MATDEELEQFFKQADTDGSGYLTRDEVKAVFSKNCYRLSDKQFEEIFQKIDSSGDDEVSLAEYISVMKAQPQVQHKAAAMRGVFQRWDKNGDGTIDKGELDNIMKEMRGKQFTEAELQRMIELVDADQSGTVDYKEFAKAIFNVDV